MLQKLRYAPACWATWLVCRLKLFFLLIGNCFLIKSKFFFNFRFVNGMVYYGLSMSSGEFGGSIFLNFVLTSLAEIPGNVLVVDNCNRWRLCITLKSNSLYSLVTMRNGQLPLVTACNGLQLILVLPWSQWFSWFFTAWESCERAAKRRTQVAKQRVGSLLKCKEKVKIQIRLKFWKTRSSFSNSWK